MKVLLVEDERRLAGVVKDGLVAEGFVVDIVSDGISGLWAATENTYDADRARHHAAGIERL